MRFAGIDFNTHTVDLVTIDLDGLEPPRWHRYMLIGETAFDRARNVRDAMPARTGYADEGVALVAVEKPFSRQFNSASALSRVQGAILACLPNDIEVLELSANEWRDALGLSRAGKKDELKAAAARYAWARGARIDWPIDATDAYCIAAAAIAICDKAAA